MPEGLEAEIWRRDLERVVGRPIVRVEVDRRVADPRVTALVGERVEGIRRHGKVVVLDTTGASLGLRFGMTGRLVVDGSASIARLAYASARDRPEWDRLRLWAGTADGTPAVRMNDPRRLGRIEIDPDLGRLGPDALSVDRRAFVSALRGRTAGVKATLMNQSVVAGLGNLCVDEVLFAAGIAPRRSTDDLSDGETAALHAALTERLPSMLEAGGSTAGVLDPLLRGSLGPCPLPDCAGALRRDTVAGRTTVWCSSHQPDAGSG